MNILYLLIPIAVAVMFVAIAALLWAIKNGQFDDLEGEAHRILIDDDDHLVPVKKKETPEEGEANSSEKDDTNSSK